MKHYYTFFFVLFSAFIFAKETVSISGKISNLDGNEVTVSGFNFKLTIPVNADGRFTKEFDIEHPGIYTFLANNDNLSIYLAKDIQLVIDADAVNFMATAKISGKNIEENKYFFEKTKMYAVLTSNPQVFYELKEAVFVKKLDSLFLENQSLLKKSTLLNPEFYSLEEKNIVHGLQPYFGNYKIMHSIYTKSFLSKAVLAEAKVIKLDDIEISNDEFLFSPVFRVIQNSKFNKVTAQKMDKNPSLCKTYIEEAFVSINNPLVQEFLLKNAAGQIKSDKKEDKYLFDALMALSKDEAFKSDLTQRMKTIGSLINGSPAPHFELQDKDDATVRLDDFKGKYVYIDFWATWCKPCIAEIPDLQKVEGKFKGKNIVFLSISIDNKKDTGKWKKFIADKDLHGVQLIGDNGWDSKISKEYLIRSVPRFILIDPEGFLIDIDAPRPSDSKLTRILNRLEKI